MLYVDIPTPKDLSTLRAVRADKCVSIYLVASPLPHETDQSRIALKNAMSEASRQMLAAGVDQACIDTLLAQLGELEEDGEFWRYQAHSLAIFVTPGWIRTFRLPNTLSEMVEVSDRFHLKPLLRAVTFRNAAFVLAVSESAVRLIEVSPDLPASTVTVPNLPQGAADAVNKSTINDRSHARRIQGDEGKKVQLAKYVRRIDAALRPILSNEDLPVILAATDPVASLVRSVSGIELEPQTIAGSPDSISDADLSARAREVLDLRYQRKIDEFRSMFEERAGQGRATTDLSDAARAATFGAIDTLLVNIDTVVDGTIDPESGQIELSEVPDAGNYGVVDEIAARAMSSGARVLAVRKGDLPHGGDLAAVLRYAV